MKPLLRQNLYDNQFFMWCNDYHDYCTCKNVPYFTTTLMIQNDGHGLLNHLRKIDWLTALRCIY